MVKIDVEVYQKLLDKVQLLEELSTAPKKNQIMAKVLPMLNL
jgi:hypothetical protein